MSLFLTVYWIISITYIQYVLPDVQRDYILSIQNGEELTWIEAEEYCQISYDSHLATVITLRDFDLIYNYSYFGGFIGLNNIDEDDEWSWIDGTQCKLIYPNNSYICDDFYELISNLYDMNQTKYCSNIPFGGYKINDFECTNACNQFYCNKVRGYHYISSLKNQYDAEKYCQSQYGTHLATIQQYDISNVIKVIPSTLNIIEFWIGLIISNDNDNNVWLDGTEYDIDNLLIHDNDMNDTSMCYSYDPNDDIIRNNIKCNKTLPFLCNKRVKVREYILHKEDKSFHDAQQFCQDTYGTDLATIITEEEFSDVLRIIPQFETAWIGLINISNQWRWLDGTNCIDDTLCIPYWNISIYSNHTNQCGYLWQIGFVATISCHNNLANFLCNKPTVIPIQGTTKEPIFNMTDSLLVFQTGIGGFMFVDDVVGETTIDLAVEYTMFDQVANNDDIIYWHLYQNLEFMNQSLYEMYADLNILNDEVRGNNIDINVIGNIILCHHEMDDELCLNKIGPLTTTLWPYLPVAVNTDFNVDNIVISMNDTKSRNIRIWGYFYSIYTNDTLKDSIRSSIKHKLFPHGGNIDYSSSIFGPNIIGEWSIYSVEYNNLELIYKDIGNPYQWKDFYSNFYFEAIPNELIIYLYGITASCANQAIYEQFLNYKGNISTTEIYTSLAITMEPGSNKNYLWMAISIVFITLFVITVLLIIYLFLFRYLDNKQESGKVGSSHEVEMLNTSPIYNM